MTATALKIFALILMTIDHIGVFIPDISLYFHWIGRLSAPIFLFFVLEGIDKTHNRKKYLLRLYLFSVGMAIMEVLVNRIMFKYPPISDNIFTVYFAVAAFIYILKWNKKKYYSIKKGLLCIFLWQILAIIIIMMGLINHNANRWVNSFFPIIRAVFGIIAAWKINTLFVIYGLILYCFKYDKKKFSIIYLLLSIIPSLLQYMGIFAKSTAIFLKLKYSFPILEYPIQFFESLYNNILIGFGFDIIYSGDKPLYTLWTVDYQWMMIGALPFLLLYNGRRGNGFQHFFYWYYPLHILVLLIIRYLINPL